jgi:hypothetical protein
MITNTDWWMYFGVIRLLATRSFLRKCMADADYIYGSRAGERDKDAVAINHSASWPTYFILSLSWPIIRRLYRPLYHTNGSRHTSRSRGRPTFIVISISITVAPLAAPSFFLNA